MDQEPEKLERELEELKEKVKLVEEALEDVQEDDDSEAIEDYTVFDWYQRKFVLHWVTNEEYDSSDIQNLEGVKTVFLEAAQSRDSSECSVQHGDMMIIGGSCAWFALCVVPNIKQKHDPHLPEVAKTEGDNIREFVVWNACADTSVDPCVRYPSLDVVVQYVHDFTVTHTETTVPGGTGEPDEKTHTITFSKDLREMVFDNCGKFVEDRDIDDGSPTVIEIKECCEEDEPEPDGCNQHPEDNATYTLTDNTTFGPGGDHTLTRTFPNCLHWTSPGPWHMVRAFNGTSPTGTGCQVIWTNPHDPFDIKALNIDPNPGTAPGTYTLGPESATVV